LWLLPILVVGFLLVWRWRRPRAFAQFPLKLAVLAGTGDFQEALHSLTAAIHLLTARPAADNHAVGPGI